MKIKKSWLSATKLFLKEHYINFSHYQQQLWVCNSIHIKHSSISIHGHVDYQGDVSVLVYKCINCIQLKSWIKEAYLKVIVASFGVSIIYGLHQAWGQKEEHLALLSYIDLFYKAVIDRNLKF